MARTRKVVRAAAWAGHTVRVLRAGLATGARFGPGLAAAGLAVWAGWLAAGKLGAVIAGAVIAFAVDRRMR